ncbi:MAG: hypothetical protein J6Y02_24185 [Pseudobutyrivibrio sp.]|nr:hypothetical protein [Pseudobutyrivibrio sp.]
MGVKVNESGTIKNLALDKDEVGTLRVDLKIGVYTQTSASNRFKPSDFGITTCMLTSKYRTDTSVDKKALPLLSTNSSTSSITWNEIPDSYKVVVRRGQFPFKISTSCKFKKFTASNYYSIDNPMNFPSRLADGGFSAKFGNNQVLLGNSGNSSWLSTAEIYAVLIIEEDGVNWRIEACLLRSSQISESNALNDSYSNYSGTFPYTAYFTDCNDDYLIEVLPYTAYDYSITPNIII